MARRRTALITGGTGSLGLRTAEALLAADDDWDVVITGRAAPDEAAARLGPRAAGLRLDLASLADVRRCARELPPLDAVVCNAGLLAASGTTWTADGIETTFGVNHLAHFLLVREVLPTMPAPGHVVFVSSATHDPARRTGFPAPGDATAAELAHPREREGESRVRTGQRRYAASKLCAVLAAYEFARRVPPEVATFTAFDPGQMPGTGLARGLGRFRTFMWHRVMPVLTLVPGINRHTPRRSGAVLARLVLAPPPTGTYVSGGRAARSSQDSYDEARARDLWDTSVALSSARTDVRRS